MNRTVFSGNELLLSAIDTYAHPAQQELVMPQGELTSAGKSRRTFLCGSILATGALTSVSVLANPSGAEIFQATQTRQLSLRNMHTGELLDVVYWENGKYIDDHIGQLNYFMRDHRENKSRLMDNNLYEFLYRLCTALDTNERIHVLSAYRTEATNALLRQSSSAVAKRSFHVAGRAVDFYIPGISNRVLQREARRLMLGGVGYYKNSGFIHTDTGYPRHWVRA